MRIAITDPGSDLGAFDRYAGWVRRWIPRAEISHLAYEGWDGDTFDVCDGLLLTGGGDVHPRYYGRLDALELARNVDERRDAFEFSLAGRALSLEIPVLGVCRGAQVFAVARGGTLIPDIERAGHPSHRRNGTIDSIHGVGVEAGSMLAEIVGGLNGTVNSSHHQSVDDPGEDLTIVARSDDGVAEALEWREPAHRPYLLLVQWHPERMTDPMSQFARNIMVRFALEVEAARHKKEKLYTDRRQNAHRPKT